MNEKSNSEPPAIGQDLGTIEMTLDESTVNDRVKLVQWAGGELMDRFHIAPPGISINQHARMRFATSPNLGAGIWAKSEHEFLKPMKMGSKIFIRGKIVDVYVKRGRNYVVSELETVDETGNVLMKSRETGIDIE